MSHPPPVTSLAPPTERPEKRAGARSHADGASSEPGPVPAWEGRTGCIGYLAKMFPRISETFILEEILALRRRGVRVKIYSLLPPIRDARIHLEAEALMPEVEILPGHGRVEIGAMLSDLWACFRVRPTGTVKQVLRLLQQPGGRSFLRLARASALAVRMRRDHVAHLHAAWAHGPASVARIASRLTGIPWSMGAHAKDIHLSDPRSLAKKITSARFTIACSAANRDLLERLAPRDPAGARHAEVMLIHHGVDAAYFAPAEATAEPGSTPPDRPVILSVGRLVPKKGFDHLLQAVARLRNRQLRFCLEIVGDGPQRRRLVKMIEELGLEDTVVLRGMLVRDEVREAFRRATCFALACRVTEDGDRDGIPNTLAEAMASGLPVVSTRLSGVEELVRDGETGILVPPGSPEALADALAGLLEDRERGRRLGQRARAAVTATFDAHQAGAHRARRFARALGVERVLYLSADRGVPVRGNKGASVHVRSVAEAMESLGLETRILTTRAGPPDGPSLSAPLVESRSDKSCRATVERLARWTRGGEPLERAILRLLDNFWLYAAGRCLAATWRPDMIYERYALTAFAGAFLARYLRVPFVLEVNSPMADEEAAFRGLRLRRLARWAEGWLIRRADRLVVVSWALHSHALRLGARHERILVLPNAVDPKRFGAAHDGIAVRERMDLNGSFVVGFCGSLKPWHGVHRLLAAAARAAAEVPELRVLIVGDGPDRPALERQARDLGIEPRVRFVGAVAHEAVADYLAACDVLSAPYEPMEGFYFSPLKVAEYLAVGRPVVVSAVGELARALDGARDVTLVPPGDAESLGRILVEHARDRFGPHEPCRASAPAMWTWTDVARRVLTAAEETRRSKWHWDAADIPAIGYVTETFPALSAGTELDELLALERAGSRLMVIALEPSFEALPPPGLERLRVVVRIVSRRAGTPVRSLAASHLRCFVRAPLAWLGGLGRAVRDARRGGWSRFAVAARMAEKARSHDIERILTGPGARVRLLAREVSILAGIPMGASVSASPVPARSTVSAL